MQSYTQKSWCTKKGARPRVETQLPVPNILWTPNRIYSNVATNLPTPKLSVLETHTY